MISVAALVYGAAVGGGLMLVARELLPGRPDTERLLDRLEQTEAPASAAAGRGTAALVERTGARVLAGVGASWKLPRRELDLLGIPVARHVGERCLGALGGLVLPAVATAVLALGGITLPLPVPLFVSLLMAAAVWVNADIDVRKRAAKARLEYRYAIASFLERARLERGAHISAEGAIHRTAAVGDGWVFERLRTELDRATLAGVTPWEALRQLAEQLDVPELASPAETFSLAGDEGASILAALGTQARALRHRLLTDRQAEANGASEKLVVPGTVLFMTVFALIGYPAFTAMLTS